MNKVLETLERILRDAPQTNIVTNGGIYRLSDPNMPTAGAVRYVKKELSRLAPAERRVPVVTDTPSPVATDSTQPPIL